MQDHRIFGSLQRSIDESEQRYQFSLDLNSAMFLKDHQIFGLAVAPEAVFLELLLAVASEVWDGDVVTLSNVTFSRPIIIDDQTPRLMQIELRELGSQQSSFEISAKSPGPNQWTRHVVGEVACTSSDSVTSAGAVSVSPTRLPEKIRAPALYSEVNVLPHEHGSCFQALTSLAIDQSQWQAALCLPRSMADQAEAFAIHPVLLDACLHAALYVNVLGGFSHDDAVAFVPQSIDRMDFYFESGLASRVYADGDRSQDDTTQSLTIVDDTDRVVASLQNVKYGTENRSSFTAAREKVQQVDVAGGAPIAAAEAGILARLQAAPEHERFDLLVGFIKIQIVEILNLDDADDQEIRKSFLRLGLDSMDAIELQFRLQQALRFSLPPGEGFEHKTMEGLAEYILREHVTFETS